MAGRSPVVESRRLASASGPYQTRLSMRTSFDMHSEQRQRVQKHAANRVRPRPANHAISHILDSLDALTPPPALRPDDHDSDSTGSRPYSVYSQDSTAFSAPHSISPGSGVEYGTSRLHLEDVDNDQQFDAALPPAIRTSRPPSGLSISSYSPAAPSPSIGTGSANGRSQRGKSPSSRKSIRSRGDKSPPKNKLSSESWVTQATRMPGQAVAMEPPGTPGTVRTQRSLRRVTSHESLRPQTADRTPLHELRALSRAEQIIAKSPPALPSPRGRLYLNEDSQAAEGSTLVSTASPALASRITDVQGHNGNFDSLDGPRATALESPSRKHSKSAIVDSIPTRTSSLRHPSRSPNPGKKKDRKQKKADSVASKAEAMIDLDRMLVPRSNSIPEASWADLGDDDDTVRRIRELREQRKSRLQATSSLDSRVPVFDPDTLRSIITPQSNAILSELKPTDDGRPSVIRAFTEPRKQADMHSTANSYGVPVPALARPYTVESANSGVASEQWRHIPIPLVPGDSPATHQERPTTAKTAVISSLSLDYSYAAAVDALQNAEREAQSPSSAASDAWMQKLDEVKSETISGSRGEPRTKSITASSTATTGRPDQVPDMQRRKSRRKTLLDSRQNSAAADRPDMPRRDSIDETISEYLNAPRLSRKVKHPITGRMISFSEVGDPAGAAVFVCVGMGLTRYVTAFYDELATTLRLRLITPDRPGVGRSEPYPSTDRTGPLSWPDDILAICQELNIQKFSLLAHSAGAIYALATALILPHLVIGKVHLLAPWIPLSQLEATSLPTVSAPPVGALPRSQRILRVLPTSFLKAANSSFMTATSASLKPANRRQMDAAREQRRVQRDELSYAPTRPVIDHQRRESMMLMDQFMPTTPPAMPDLPIAKDAISKLHRGSIILSATALPTDPEFSFASTALNAAEHAERERQLDYTSRLTEQTWELATRDSNPATDLLVCLERNREIGFRYTDVTRKVIITHGSEDKRVPVGNVKWLAEQMNLRAYMGRVGGDDSGLGDDRNVPSTRAGWADSQHTGGRCEVRVLPGEGHRLMASAPIMSGVLTEIAKYWTGTRVGGPVGGEEKSLSI